MKVISRLLKCKRGVGTVVAAVMALAIIMFFVGGTFLWQVTVQNHMNKLDKDRMDERFSIEATFNYDDETKTYEVAIKVKNIGTIDAQLVQIWIIDDDHNDHQHIDISYTLPVGSYQSLTQTEIDELADKLSNPLDVATITYYFKVVTARGNIATSRLVPRAATESLYPVVIMPGASYVKKTSSGAEIHLEVWNRLDEDITIDLIVATKYEKGVPKTELIPETGSLDWTLVTGDITRRTEYGEKPEIYNAPVVLIELVNTDGIVVSSYYFTVI